MAKRKSEPEQTRADLEQQIRQLQAINRDIRQSELKASLSRAARENERLRSGAGLPLPSSVLSAREYPPVEVVRERERGRLEQTREACGERLDEATARVATLRERLAREASDETVRSLARALTEEREARHALEVAEAHARRTAPIPGAPIIPHLDRETLARLAGYTGK